MIDFLLGSIVSALSIWIGFRLGKGSSIIPEETVKQVKQLVENLPIKQELGTVERPTAHDLKRFEDPRLAEEEKVMGDTFKQIIKP